MFDLLPNAQRQAVYFHDFGVGSAAPGLKVIASGTASAISAGTATASQHGIVIFSTGTETTGYAGYQKELTSVLLGGGKILIEACGVNFPTLSTGSETYTFRFGLNSAADGTAGTSFVGFEYSSGSSSGKWRGVTKATSSTVVVGGTVAAATNYRLTLVVEPLGDKVSFFVDGTLIGYSTATIPATTVPLGLVTTILKSAGTTARTVQMDYIKSVKEFSTQR